MSSQHQNQRAEVYKAPLLIDKLSCAYGPAGHCPTCADDALPVRVLSIGEESGQALVEIEGTLEEIDITLVEAVAVGDRLLVHGGVAMGRIEEQGR